MLDDLLEINRNSNGDYYFIYEVKNVKNYINVKGKPRQEVIIVGVPKSQLKTYLKSILSK